MSLQDPPIRPCYTEEVSISARTDPDQKERLKAVADRLGIGLSEFVLKSSEAAAEQIEGRGYICFRVYLRGLEILGLGEVPPEGWDGTVDQVVDLVAPEWFFEGLRSRLG
jgi:hypothetical protein